MGYALHVQDNIKENDYFRTTTGEIFKAVASKDGKVYYAFGEHYWVDSIAITDFKENIKDLVQVGDIVEIEDGKYEVIYDESINKLGILIPDRNKLAIRHSTVEFLFNKHKDIYILTKEKFESECFKVEEGQDV